MQNKYGAAQADQFRTCAVFLFPLLTVVCTQYQFISLCIPAVQTSMHALINETRGHESSVLDSLELV